MPQLQSASVLRSRVHVDALDHAASMIWNHRANCEVILTYDSDSWPNGIASFVRDKLEDLDYKVVLMSDHQLLVQW